MKETRWPAGQNPSGSLAHRISDAGVWVGAHPVAKWVLPAIFFAMFVASISYRVTPNNGVLMYGDYPYYWPGAGFDATSAVQSSFLGHIRLVGMSATPLMGLPRLLSFLPASWSSYLLTYGLVYAASLTYYFVTRKLTGSPLLAFTAGLFIVLNNVVLEYLVVQPAHIFLALIAYALTIYLALAAPRVSVREVIALAVFSLVITHPYFWALQTLLATGLLLSRAREGRRLVWAAARMFGLMVLLASYWIIPLAVALRSSRTAELYAGNQDAVFEGVRAKVQHLEAFTLFQYPGTWQSSLYGGRLPHTFYFASLALVIAVFTVRARVGTPRRIFLFLFVLYVATLNLGLGPNSLITGAAWQYAYDQLPGFGFFRTFSRFFILTLVALVFLVVYALNELRQSGSRFYRVTAVSFLLLLAASHSVFFTGDLNGTITAGKVPKEYARLNELLSSAGSGSIITYPNVEYEAYDWNANRNQHAYAQPTYFKELYLNQSVIFNRLALHDLNIQNNYFPRLLAYDSTFTFYREFDKDLNRLDVKYVLVHKDQIDILRLSEPKPFYGRYITYFSRNRAYRLIEDNDVFALFENKHYRPRLRSQHAHFQKINDTSYRLYLSDLNDKRNVTFLQRFDKGWQLYPRRPAEPWCRKLFAYDGHLVECAKGDEEGSLASKTSMLAARPLRAPHTTALGYANQWEVDPSFVRSQLTADYYSVNRDGSINLELIIYFRPQSYFYLGLLITAVTLVTLAGLMAAHYYNIPANGG